MSQEDLVNRVLELQDMLREGLAVRASLHAVLNTVLNAKSEEVARYAEAHEGTLDPHELESLLEYELETHHKEAHMPGHAMQQVADALPGFGIVAAVLGIVNTMAAIDGADTATIGHKVAAALVGTFLGILIAYGFAGPLASALQHRAEEESKAFEVVKMALVASVRGYAPKVSVEFARKLLFSQVRPTFADLEG